MSKKLSRTSKGIAHHSPGRTRLKIPRNQRHHMRKIEEKLTSARGVTSVEVNQKTGSILVHHDNALPIFEVLHKTVETVGGDLLTTLIEGETAELLGPVSLLAAGVGLVAGFGRSLLSAARPQNGVEKTRTALPGNLSDLKILVPAGFLLAAAYKAYQTRSFWEGLTPLALTYWAFDTYWRFNVAGHRQPEPEKNRSTESAPQHG
jgi:hypothetical protein